MAERIRTSLKVTGSKSTVDMNMCFKAMTDAKLKCAAQNGGSCSINTSVTLGPQSETPPVSEVFFSCWDYEGRGCIQRIIGCAQNMAEVHVGLNSSEVEVQVSVDGVIERRA